MRVVHLSTYELAGGAARAADGLHRGLVAIGVESSMIVLRRQTDDPRVSEVNQDEFDLRIWDIISTRWITNNRSDLSDTLFSPGAPGTPTASHDRIRHADVVNLHWVPGLLDARGIGEILALGKPVIWTLHDEWPYTGGCHYTSGCEQWTTGCSDCPQLIRDPHRMVAAMFSEKSRHYSRGQISVVTPSRWLSERARQSALLRRMHVETIPNGVDLDIFAPDLRSEGRRRLGIDDKSAIVLFSADAATERRKGFSQLCDALSTLRSEAKALGVADISIQLVVLGFTDGIALPEGAMSLGHLSDRSEIASVIAASDLYVLPSLEDNLPNGLLEAVACGTACVAFETGGIPDVLSDAPLAFMAPVGNVRVLAEKIAEGLRRLEELRRARPMLRAFAEARYSLTRQANAYFEIYTRECNVPAGTA